MKWHSAAGRLCGDGSLSIYWDPDGSIPDSSITTSSGTPGYGVEANRLTWLAPNLVGGIGLDGQTVGVLFTGDPGPIGLDGAPESLAGFAGNPVYVWAEGGYHEEYGFQLQTLPEPSGLLHFPAFLKILSEGFTKSRARSPRLQGWGFLPSRILSRLEAVDPG